jgi:hypothetical protein
VVLCGVLRKQFSREDETSWRRVASFRTSAQTSAKVGSRDVYIGLHEIRLSETLRVLCRKYPESFCFDTTWDVAKRYILKAVAMGLEREMTDSSRAASLDFLMVDVESDPLLRLPEVNTAETPLTAAEAAGGEDGDLFSEASVSVDEASSDGKSHLVEVVDENGLARIVNLRVEPHEEDQVVAMNMLAHRAAASLGKPLARESRDRVTAMTPDGIPMPRPPIAYAVRDVHGDREALEAQLCGIGPWRYELAGCFQRLNDLSDERLDASANFGAMQEFLRIAEWGLHHTSIAASFESKVCAKNGGLSRNFWRIDADRFMARQINSRLPVCYTTHNDETARAHKSASIADFSENFWAIQNPASAISLMENSSWTIQLESPQATAFANLERGAPSVSNDLSSLCRDYSHTCAALIGEAAAGRLERAVDRLPAVRFVLDELSRLASKEGLLGDPLNEFDDNPDDGDGLSYEGSGGTGSSGDMYEEDELMTAGVAEGRSPPSIEEIVGTTHGTHTQQQTKASAAWAVAMYMEQRTPSEGAAI